MSSVDNRVVKMQFDNATFKKEALATKASLEQVDAAVAKTGSNKGLLSMGAHMDTVRVKASAMQVATVTAIANIANRAVNAGISMAKSLSLDPIKQGFAEYELKMKSIQTILANTKGENLGTVSAALQELNLYADKTIYNFANMTENIGKLTTAGIELDDATATVKGFSNMVALAGGDATAAAGAMEQFGQGLQAGAIKAMDWMSISNRGLGSQSLQKAFFETARAAGALKDVPLSTTFEQWAKDQGGFKASLEAGWLTTETATETLKIMTGDIENVQDLVAKGFSPEVAKDMLEIAENALDSATKVRTFTAFLDTTKEALASGWGGVIESIVGDFNESTEMFTRWSEFTGNIIGKFFTYVGNLAEGFRKFGGTDAALKAIQHVLAPIGATIKLIAGAWREVFGGSKTGKGLATAAKGLEHITRPLEVLAKLIEGAIGPVTFFFRLLRIGYNALRNLGDYIINLLPDFGSIFDIEAPSSGGFIGFIKDLAKEIAKAMERIDELLAKGSSLTSAFGAVDIKMPGLPDLSSVKMPSMDTSGLPDFSTMFSGFSTAGAVGQLDNVKMSLAGVNDEAADSVTVGDKVIPVIQGAWDTLRNFFEGFNIEDLMSAFNLAVLSTFIISISRFMNTFSQSVGGFAKLGPTIISTIEGLGGALDTFASAANKEAWAKVILNVAIAVGILSLSLWLLSKIPFDQMLTGLIGMAGIMMIMKVGVDSITKAVEAMDGKGTPFKLIGLSIALLALGAAVLMLSGAFLILNKVDWGSMLKGLGTIVVVMMLMERMGKVGEHGAKNLMASAVALMALSVSMIVLAGALMLFQLVDWESMLKGGLVLGAIVGALFILATIPYAGIEKVGLAMFAASIGFLAIANALLIFGLVSWESIAKGGVALLGLTAALAILQIVGNPVTISGMIGLGVGLLAIAAAMLVLNSVEWSSLGKMGLVMLGLIAAFALFMGIVYLAAPVLPLLTGLALSLALLAGAIALMTLAFAAILPLLAIGVGAFAAFATGAAVAIGVFLTSLALQAPVMKKSVLTILQTLIDTIVEAVPMVIDGFKRLWAAIKKEIGGGGGGGGGGQMQASMGKAGESWMTKLTDAIKKKMPGIVDKAVEIGKKFIDGLIKHAPVIAQKGADLVIALINGLSTRIGDIANSATNLIIKFAEGIGNNLSRILDAGVKLIADFLHRLADTIRSGSAAIGGGIRDVVDAMKSVGIDAVKGIINGIDEMFGDAMNAIGNLASGMVNKAKGILDIFSPSRVFKAIGKFLVEGLTIGIQQNAASAITAVASMVGGQIAVASAYISDFVQKLDQQAIAATAKAEGLARAAETASKLADQAAKKADKTKGKADDRKAKKAQESADKLAGKANRAEKKAQAAEARADAAAAAEERKREFAEADTFDKAKMRSEDAQSAMDASKAAEQRAAASLEEAKALEKQAKADGVTKKQRKEMLKQADELRKAAKRQAEQANTQIANAQTAAADALAWQKQAGDEAAAAFQAQFEREAQEDAAQEAFEKLTTEEKAAERRRQAAALQAEANKDLQDAKLLAYTDLEAANELAAEAMEQAEQARAYLSEAAQLDQQAADAAAQGSGQANVDTNSTVVNLDPTEAASIAFNRYNELYSDASAAAAGTRTVEFNQYNTSPEALTPSEIYRQSNNLLSFAADQL